MSTRRTASLEDFHILDLLDLRQCHGHQSGHNARGTQAGGWVMAEKEARSQQTCRHNVYGIAEAGSCASCFSRDRFGRDTALRCQDDA